MITIIGGGVCGLGIGWRLAQAGRDVTVIECHIAVAKRPAFTRFNVFLRDRFSCQYCGDGHSASDLTFDHLPWRWSPNNTGAATITDRALAGRINHVYP